MTISRSRRFVFVDTKPNLSKKQVFIFGSIIASSCLSGAFLIALYIEYLHNPAFHSFIQSRGIFLWFLSSLIIDNPCKTKKALNKRASTLCLKNSNVLIDDINSKNLLKN